MCCCQQSASGEGGLWPVPAEQELGGAASTKVKKYQSKKNTKVKKVPKYQGNKRKVPHYQGKKKDHGKKNFIVNQCSIIGVPRSARARMTLGSRSATPLNPNGHHHSTSPQPDPERY